MSEQGRSRDFLGVRFEVRGGGDVKPPPVYGCIKTFWASKKRFGPV